MTQLFEIQLRNGTAADWTSANPTLLAGELGFETNTGKFKIGNGSLDWASLPYFTSSAGASGAYTLNGSRGTPNNVTAGGGITVLGVQRELQFIQGAGAPVTITATPPIQAGTSTGQELVLVGCHATNTVTFDTASGVVLNGAIVMGSAATGGSAGSVLSLVWDGTAWNEVSRR